MPFFKNKKLAYISMSIDIYLQCIILANLPASGGRRPPKFVRPQQSLFARIFCRILPIFCNYLRFAPKPAICASTPQFRPPKVGKYECMHRVGNNLAFKQEKSNPTPPSINDICIFMIYKNDL